MPTPSYGAVSAWLQISFGMNTLLGAYGDLTKRNIKTLEDTKTRIIEDFISATSASSADQRVAEEPKELGLWKITVTQAVNGYQKSQKTLARVSRGTSIGFAGICALLILFGQEFIEWAPSYWVLFWLVLMAPLPVYLMWSRFLKETQVKDLRKKTDSIKSQYQIKFGIISPSV